MTELTGGTVTAGSAALTPLRSRVGGALIAATVLASMVGFLDANVVNVAVPAIGRDLNAGVAALQWTLTGYLLTVAALLLLAGALADTYGRRRMLLVGLLVMLVASLLCVFAPSIGALIAARVVQGAGAALVVPTSLSLLNGTLRGPDRARGIGIWAGLSTIGTTVGPYVGGWLVDHQSWRWVFLLNVPLILLSMVALRSVPESRSGRPRGRLDLPGALLTMAGLGGVIYALTEGATDGWGRAPVIVLGVIGIVALAALIPTERRQRDPMLRLSLFRSRQFSAINATTVLLYGALAAASYLVILQCQLRLGYSAAAAGAALIPSSLVFLALAPISGAAVARVGPRLLMVAGIVAIAGAFAWLSRARPGQPYAQVLLPSTLLWGLGLGLTVTPLTAAVLAAVRDEDLGEASAINDASARLGAVIAIAAVPVLIGATGASLAHALVHGYQPAMLVLAGVALASTLITARFVSDQRGPAPKIAAPAPHHGCALPVTDPPAQPVAAGQLSSEGP